MAAWFARRWPDRPSDAVYAAEISPRHVLGLFRERQEAEVVVNPRGIRNLRALDPASWVTLDRDA